MIGILKRTAASRPRSELLNLAQAFGINPDTNSILWDDDLMEIANPASGIYWDWMRNMLASGGVFQYEANQFVLAVKDAGIQLDDIDKFASTIHWPRKYPALPTLFFAKRVTANFDGHMHAFAGEMLNVETVLVLFAECVLRPAGILEDHCMCLHHVHVVLGIL